MDEKNFRIQYYAGPRRPARCSGEWGKEGRRRFAFQTLRRLLRQFRSIDPRISSGGVSSTTEPRRSP